MSVTNSIRISFVTNGEFETFLTKEALSLLQKQN